MSDAGGAVAASYSYDSFGNLTASTGSIVNHFRYTARELDLETGLYFYRARYYDQSVGRFIWEDPIRFAGGENFYLYVYNDPMNFTDPMGLQGTQPIPTPKPIPPPPVPSPTPPTPRPTPVPRLPMPSVGRIPIIGPIIGAIGIVLTCPLELNSGEEEWLRQRERERQRDCDEEWREAYRICADLLSRPNPPRGLTGGYKNIHDCARGFVSEECGGNPIDWGPSGRRRRK